MYEIKTKLGGNALMSLVLLTAIFNGCTQGYDQSMMNNLNLIDKYVDYFHLNNNLLGLNVALINAGSVLGGLFAGQLCDKYGRKWGIAVSAFITIVAVIIQASATHEAAFCVGRILLGISITVNGCAAPVWVMEMAHPKNRGLMGGLYMAIWYFAAIIVSGISLGTYTYNSTWAWRGLAIGQVVPSLLSLSLLPLTPESPRWLISQDRHEEAFGLLVRLHGEGNPHHPLVLAEFKEIRDTIAYEKLNQGDFKSLIAPKANLRRFGIVIVLNIAAQIIGSNIVSSFFGLALEGAGITETKTQMIVTLVLNIWDLVCAVAGSFSMEFLGRKGMLFYTSCLMTFFLVLMSILGALYPSTSSNTSAQYATVSLMFLFLGSYSFAWTPLTFVYPIEILNYGQRAKGIAVGQMACYAFGFVNQYTTPIALESIGWRYYAVNASWNVVICVIIWFFFVETKGLALEEVDGIFDGVVHSDGVHVGDGRNVLGKGEEGMEGIEGDGTVVRERFGGKV